jgi:hypothetical protein
MPMLASHFHDEITRQAWTSPLLIVFGVVVFAVALERSGRMDRRLLIGLALLLAVGGTYRLVELPALQHNHLCHGHGSDACPVGHRRDDHSHPYWFGGRVGKPRSAADWARFSPAAPPPAQQVCSTEPVSAQAFSTRTTRPAPLPGCIPANP